MVGIIGAAALTSALFVGVPAGAFASEPAGSGIESCSGQWSEVSVSDSLLRHMKLFLMKVAHGSTVPTR